MESSTLVKNNKQTKWFTAFAAMILIVLGTYSSIFSLAAFGICALAFLLVSNAELVFILFFIMPFANIFKMSPSSQSFFTFLMIAYVAFYMLKAKSFNGKVIMWGVFLVSFLVFQMLFSMNMLRTIKFIVNILFVYLVWTEVDEKEYRDIFLGYTTGMIITSLLAAFDIIPNLEAYIALKESTVQEVAIGRFSGLYGDPNYYAVNVIIALCLMVILFCKKEINWVVFGVFSIALISFAIMTHSKSAFLMLAIPVLMFLYANIRNKRFVLVFLCILLLIVFGVRLMAGQIEFLQVVMERLTASEDINALTTGRVGIWERYMTYFKESALRTFLGNGFGADLLGGRAAHNTYVDLIYFMGVLGTLILGITLSVIWKSKPEKARKNLLNFSALLVIVIMYFFLSQLFYFDLPFHILLAMMVLKMNIAKKARG